MAAQLWHSAVAVFADLNNDYDAIGTTTYSESLDKKYKQESPPASKKMENTPMFYNTHLYQTHKINLSEL